MLANSLSPRPAGLCLLEPGDLRLLTVHELQLDEHIAGWVRAGALTSAAGRQNSRLVHAQIVSFRTTGTATTSGMAPRVARASTSVINPNNAAYARSDDELVPATYAAKLPSSTKVLMTDGTRDSKIPPSSTGPLVSALRRAHVSGPGYRLIKGIDHDLHLADRPDLAQVLAPAVVDAIDSWAKEF